MVESSMRSGRSTEHVLRIDDEVRRVDTIALTHTSVVLVMRDEALAAAAAVGPNGTVYFGADRAPKGELPDDIDDATAFALELACDGELPPAEGDTFRLRPAIDPFACVAERWACRHSGGWACDPAYYDCMSGL